MEPTTAAPTIVFHPLTPEFIGNPHPTCRELRERAPIFYWENGHAWVVTRFAESCIISRDRRFGLDYTEWEYAPPPPPAEAESDFDKIMKYGLFRLSEPDHVRVRRLVAPTFGPRGIEPLRADIACIVNEAIEQSLHGGVLDVLKFAEHVPARVMSLLLGIPVELDTSFRNFRDAVIEASNPAICPERFAQVKTMFAAGAAMLRELVEERRRRPSSDLLSQLIWVEEQGSRLSREELLALITALIAAGSETTMNLIAYAVLNLLRQPTALALLRSDPTLVRSALDEVLRFDYFTTFAVPRYARQDLSLCGTSIRKGQMVMSLIVGALRDPAAFADPDVFDLHRTSNPNITFGFGAHHCLGEALARVVGQLAIETFLRRFPKAELLGPPEFKIQPVMRPLQVLRVGVGA